MKIAWDLVYPADFWDTQEIREIELIGLRGWKLKNTDFSRELKTPDCCIKTSNRLQKTNVQ